MTRIYKGDWEGAIRDATEAIKIKPDFAEAYVARAPSHQLKGDMQHALPDLNRAPDGPPDVVPPPIFRWGP